MKIKEIVWTFHPLLLCFGLVTSKGQWPCSPLNSEILLFGPNIKKRVANNFSLITSNINYIIRTLVKWSLPPLEAPRAHNQRGSICSLLEQLQCKLLTN